MTDLQILLPTGEVLPGSGTIVIIGPNGSGKTRLSRKLVPIDGAPIEFVNALRSTRISPQIPAMSQLQARQQHEGHRNQARSNPWEISSDFDYMVAQILAEDGDAARHFRAVSKAGASTDAIEPTPLEILEVIWSEVFPGRSLDWQDWAPVVRNEREEILTYTASQMSDGERAALYLGAKVMLAPPNSVMVVDEPETHFHSLLAIALWDSLEAHREDMRFVYVTHDLTFAMSRVDATFLLADGAGSLKLVSLEEDLPGELKKSILGAASFSYYASRVVFCEGEAHSFDRKLFGAWFNGRDTVVSPVGSCDAVQACVNSLSRARLVDNLLAVGIIDRDYRPDQFFDGLEGEIYALPFHEIEGILCLPEIVTALADHLGRDVVSVVDVISDRIDEEMILRVAHDRWKAAILRVLEDSVTVKAEKPLTEDSLRRSVGEGFPVDKISSDVKDVFEKELERVRADASSRDVMRILRTFPSKALAGAVSARLGQSPSQCFELISRALIAGSDTPLASLGKVLESALQGIGFPARNVALRNEPVSPA